MAAINIKNIKKALGEAPIHVQMAEEEHAEYIADRAEKGRKSEILLTIEKMVKNNTYGEIRAFIKGQRSEYLVGINANKGVSGDLERISFLDEYDSLSSAYYQLWFRKFPGATPLAKFQELLNKMFRRLGHKIRHINHVAFVLGYLCLKDGAISPKRVELAHSLSKDQVSVADIVRYSRLWKNAETPEK